MMFEFDGELTHEQWEVLKGLRGPGPAKSTTSARVCAELATMQLIELSQGSAVLTSLGRRVLVRGSSRLLDLAA